MAASLQAEHPPGRLPFPPHLLPPELSFLLERQRSRPLGHRDVLVQSFPLSLPIPRPSLLVVLLSREQSVTAFRAL